MNTGSIIKTEKSADYKKTALFQARCMKFRGIKNF